MKKHKSKQVKYAPPSKVVAIPSVLAATPLPLKLDLGCGVHKKPDFIGVDRLSFPGVDIVTDLRQKWPWGDSTVEEAHCSHFLEHLDAKERVFFWNELYRVMKSGAKAMVITPHWCSCRAYGDPSHQWPPVSEFTFLYLNRDWRLRDGNAPHTDKSNVEWGFDCHFLTQSGYSFDNNLATRNQEYVNFALANYKEAAQDLITTVTKA